ncbi:MAG: hypothetical protein LIP11_13985 [Clostridiales bacterium]|nr:hypothetical protein [Clostridiales bacterium]
MGKKKSAIEKVVIEGRSYNHEEFEPTFINFFFGRNGAGKWESVSVPFSAYSDRFEKDITGLDD